MTFASNTVLKYLTVDLFVYDLRDGLGQDEAQIEQNRRKFWQRIYNGKLNEQDYQKFSINEEQASNYIELLGSHQRIEKLKYPWNGYYLPLLLGDTYAVQIDCSGEIDWEGQAQTLENLREIQATIANHLHSSPGTIGQTWLVWGQLTQPTSAKDLQTIAHASYKALKQDESWESSQWGQGSFMGAMLFGVWQPPINVNQPQGGSDTLICLFPYDSTEDQIKLAIGKLYRNLTHLLSYRHKILWVYYQSRRHKAGLKRDAATIRELVDQRLPSRMVEASPVLKQLQKDLSDTLKIFSNYSQEVSTLQAQRYSLEINIDNYRKRLDLISEVDSAADLGFLREFETYAREKYLKQVTSDCDTFGIQLRLLESVTRTIEGIINIEQTKRDRQLNQTVAIAGVWIGTASAAASLISPIGNRLVEEVAHTNPQQPSTSALGIVFGVSLLLSLAIGLAAAVAWKYLFYRSPK